MLDENALVIAVSSSGRTSEIIDAAQIAKENHARVVCLTSNPLSPLTKISDDVLLSAHREGPGGHVGHTRYTFASYLGSPFAGILAALLVWQGVFAASSAALLIMGVLCFICFTRMERRGLISYFPSPSP